MSLDGFVAGPGHTMDWMAPVRLELLTGQDRRAAVDVRYRPTTAGRPPHTPSSPGN
jgi:hypothetical protein